MIFSDEEKERFRRLMRLVEEFCCVRILTYSLMTNHFHILVEVPRRREVSDEELVEKLKLLYNREFVGSVADNLKQCREDGEDESAEKLKNRFIYRMFDLSEFIKTLKQRYTQSYNNRNDRKGTLWEERFKSVMIEGTEHALSTMAAYVDLNAVRAGMVEDPKDYRYCGYGEAVAGGKRAREGLGEVMMSLGQAAEWRKASRGYRKYLYVSGGEKGIDADGRAIREGFSVEKVEKVLAEGGRLGGVDLLRCRVRYLSDGVALGSRDFVDGVFRKYRKSFGEKRKSGARAMRWGDWGGLCTARDLRRDVVSVPGQ